ncbi:hypothetical protein J6590_039086 [Homalodisca vitripennis]|nr:hypothetical protein J6590_039086 [Homalodisca vitripennis]
METRDSIYVDLISSDPVNIHIADVVVSLFYSGRLSTLRVLFLAATPPNALRGKPGRLRHLIAVDKVGIVLFPLSTVWPVLPTSVNP